jgi:hypothetical protein
MLLSKTAFVLPSLVLSAAAMPLLACDTGDGASEPAPTVVERGTTKNCWKSPISKQTTSFTYRGVPVDPYGDPDNPLGPLTPFQQEVVAGNVGAVQVSAYQSSEEGAAACPEVCQERGLRWGGDACVFEQAFEASEAYPVELEDGAIRTDVEVYGEVQLGCACAEASRRRG